MVGTFRRINQSISFEIVFRVLILRVAIFNGSFSRILFNSYSVILLIPACTGMFLASATELGRTPFDLLEGERELVRGFNVELGEKPICCAVYWRIWNTFILQIVYRPAF